MDAILAVFLATALGLGEAHPPAAEPTGHCEYHVSPVSGQGLLVCEDRTDGAARPLSSRPEPPAAPGSGASSRTDSSHGDADAGR